MERLPTKDQIARGEYAKWDKNSELEKECLRYLGLPEDFHPTEEQAYYITVIAFDF